MNGYGDSKMEKRKKPAKRRSIVALGLALRTGGFAGKHHTRDRDVFKGRSRKAKHKGNQPERAADPF
jgi:hypothetical protein